jgi:hypothetical protein
LRYSACVATNVLPSPVLSRDVALVQDDAAHQLHVEEPHAHGALGLPRTRTPQEQLVERLAALKALAELGRLAKELVVGQRLEVGLERADVGRLLCELLALAFADAATFSKEAELLEPYGSGTD